MKPSDQEVGFGIPAVSLLIIPVAVLLSMAAGACDPEDTGTTVFRTPQPQATNTPLPTVPSTNTKPAPTPTLAPTVVVNGPESSCAWQHWIYAHQYRQVNFIQWSPDGSSLVFDFDEVRGRDEAIWMVSADGSGLRKLVDANPQLGYHSWLGFYADLSPDGSRIVYSTCEYTEPGGYSAWPRYHDIAVASIDGSSARRLTYTSGYENYPVWSPDGTRIAYLFREDSDLTRGAQHDREGHIRVVSATSTSNPGRVKSIGSWAAPYQPAWSPEGRYLAILLFDVEEEYNPPEFLPRYKRPVLYVTEVDNAESEGAVLGITTTPPAWSPDGSRIAFAGGDWERSIIYVGSPDGSDLRQIWKGEGHVYGLDWHPDGSEILVLSQREGYTGKLWAINPDGNDMRDLLPEGSPIQAGVAVWSPDGSKLAARSLWADPDYSGRWNVPAFRVFTLNRDGVELRLLAVGDQTRRAGFRVCDGAPVLDIAEGAGLDSCLTPEPQYP